MWLAAWQITLELAPWLLLGAAVAGLLHRLLPSGFLQRHLRGRAGVLKAVAVGVPLPLCSCGVIPAGLGLKRDGAGDGPAVAFLVSTPQTGVDSVLVSAGAMGWPFALFKLASAALTGIAAGLLVDRFGGPPVPFGGDAGEAEAAGGGRDWRDALRHAIDILRGVWAWLVVGILASAALTAWLPPDLLPSLGLTGPWAPLLVLLVALPLYVCATASVPLAAGLVAAGMPPAAALVFLLAGPATNLATMGAVLRAFGRRVLALYLGTLVAGSLLLAWAYDAWLGSIGPLHHLHQAGEEPWRIVPAVLLLALLAGFALEAARSRVAAHRAARGLELPVEGMTCRNCALRLERALGAVEGVDAVSVSLEDRTARVRGRAGRDALVRAVEAAGFRSP